MQQEKLDETKVSKLVLSEGISLREITFPLSSSWQPHFNRLGSPGYVPFCLHAQTVANCDMSAKRLALLKQPFYSFEHLIPKALLPSEPSLYACLARPILPTTQGRLSLAQKGRLVIVL
jgi:hypothetical protein